MSKLNPKWEAFCIYYAGLERGNATLAYARAYNRDTSTAKSYRIAQTSASRLLLNAMVSKRISELMATQGITEENLDTKLCFLVDQIEDYGVSLRAIIECNKILGRTTNNGRGKSSLLNYEQFLARLK